MKALVLTLVLIAPAVAVADGDQTVIQKGRRFSPAEVTIGRGEALTFTNNDEFIHQIYSEGLFDTDERPPGQNIRVEFPRAGTFEVHCHIHPKMKLVVHVN